MGNGYTNVRAKGAQRADAAAKGLRRTMVGSDEKGNNAAGFAVNESMPR
jgi:hypothetical protein